MMVDFQINMIDYEEPHSTDPTTPHFLTSISKHASLRYSSSNMFQATSGLERGNQADEPCAAQMSESQTKLKRLMRVKFNVLGQLLATTTMLLAHLGVESKYRIELPSF
jgi:hypothetical protein